jgi:hypothetical protein
MESERVSTKDMKTEYVRALASHRVREQNLVKQQQRLIRDHKIMSEKNYELKHQITKRDRHRREIACQPDATMASYEMNPGHVGNNELQRLKAKNRELGVKYAKLCACLEDNDRKSLEIRLGRLYARSDELSASNKLLHDELTRAFGVNARLQFRLALSMATSERMKTLSMASDENPE